MANMMSSPIILNDYLGPTHFKYREPDERNFLGDAQIFINGFKREKDRIEIL